MRRVLTPRIISSLRDPGGEVAVGLGRTGSHHVTPGRSAGSSTRTVAKEEYRVLNATLGRKWRPVSRPQAEGDTGGFRAIAQPGHSPCPARLLERG